MILNLRTLPEVRLLFRGKGGNSPGITTHNIWLFFFSSITRGNGRKLCQGRVRLDIRKKYLIGKSGIALEQVVVPPSLEVLHDCGGVALRDMVSGHSGDRLGLDLGDRSGLFQP